MDEATKHAKFEDAVGGVKKAYQMLRIWNDSYKCDMRPQGRLHTKTEVFTNNALRNNFTLKQIDMFLSLQ